MQHIDLAVQAKKNRKVDRHCRACHETLKTLKLCSKLHTSTHFITFSDHECIPNEKYVKMQHTVCSKLSINCVVWNDGHYTPSINAVSVT